MLTSGTTVDVNIALDQVAQLQFLKPQFVDLGQELLSYPFPWSEISRRARTQTREKDLIFHDICKYLINSSRIIKYIFPRFVIFRHQMKLINGQEE